MALSTTQLKFFADYIQAQLGIIYSPENYFQLEKRLVEIAKGLSLPDEQAVYQKAQMGINGMFKQLLLDIATNNETSFFRDPKAFTAIEKFVIPAIREQHPNLSVIRIWCAASSFGQEPYSLAMMLTEMAAKNPGFPRFEIVATDISEAALTRAKEGRYSQLEVQRGLPAPLLVKYFKKSEDDQWILQPEIRICVQYKKQNLLDALNALGTFDLVLCRNVLIYQKEDKKREIIEQIYGRIVPNGYLIMGAAESLLGVTDKFNQVFKEGAVYFQRRDSTGQTSAKV